MTRAKFILSTALLLSTAVAATASDLNDALDRRFAGAWATTAVEVYSGCSGTYSNNDIGPAGVISKAARRFAPGELIKIDKVKVKRSRIDLLVTLAEPVLVPWTDGPFTLFDERQCKAQLIITVPRSVIKTGDVVAAAEACNSAVTAHHSRRAAIDSGQWNGRRRRPLPADYDHTVALHERWKAEQTNTAVTAKMDDAAEEAADVADDIERDPEYLDGFAAGIEKMHRSGPSSCSSLVEASFSTWRDSPPSGQNSAWKRGWEDGQRLAFNVHLLDELRHCFVEIPSDPATASRDN